MVGIHPGSGALVSKQFTSDDGSFSGEASSAWHTHPGYPGTSLGSPKVGIQMIIKFMIRFFLVVVVSFVACRQEKKTVGFTLSETEIINLIQNLDASRQEKLAFYVFYSEQMNDSSAIFSVYQSLSRKDTLGVCKTFKFGDQKVFIYDSLRCRIGSSNILKSKNSPIVNDGLFWMVLARRRFGQIEYMNLLPFSQYDPNFKIEE